MRFAYGDFDGDQQTDQAFVQSAESRDGSANYLIEFRFSNQLPAVLKLRGPVGGLQIAARDVNGDQQLDLVVRTALDASLVAVLVNDGRGNFTIAQASDFPELQNTDDRAVRRSVSTGLEQLATLASSDGRGAMIQPKHFGAVALDATPLFPAQCPGVFVFDFLNVFGRGPPTPNS